VSSAGDVNGDGFCDVIIGAALSSPINSRGEAGVTYVVFGHSISKRFEDVDLSTAILTTGRWGFKVHDLIDDKRYV